jgi:type IV secretory pathway TrbL component
MTSHRRTMRLSAGASLAAALIGACALFAVVSAPAPAQEASPPSGDGAPGAQRPSERPGLFDSLGRLFEEGANNFKSGLQGAQETLGRVGSQARDVAKDATGAVIGLPSTRVVNGHERCPAAQNGAPDCQIAATTVCRGKGFQTGKSVDTQSEQKCPAHVLLSGRTPNNTECPTEIFVTRAMCQ